MTIRFGQNIAKIQKDAIDEVNAAMGEVRKRFITVAPGQDMLYGAKEAEAIRYLSLPEEPADLADFPLLAGEVGLTAESPYQLAQVIAYMANQWRTMTGPMERLRLGTIYTIEAATDRPAVTRALAAFHDTLAEGV
jgi:hypothetical protein